MIDICRTTDAVVLDYEVDLIIQQIDILFDTTPGEVLGDMRYGSDYERFLHELNIGSSMIADYVRRSIYNNVDLFGWTLDVEVQFALGTMGDIMFIGIMFSKDGDNYSHVYKVTTCPDDEVIS